MEVSIEANVSKRKDGDDRICSLPDPVLHLILSRLPSTEESIRSSILSKRWRNVWTSVPSIDIDCSRRMEFSTSKFKEFVDGVLAKSSLNLESFRLCCENYYSIYDVEKWIQAVVKRNIKQLHLLFCCGHWLKLRDLPDCLGTCGSLEVLRLYLYSGRVNLFRMTGFSGLRVLEMNNSVLLATCGVYVCDFLKRISDLITGISKELFDIVRTSCGRIEIVCPKLVFFEFGAFTADAYIFRSLGSLKKAVIHPEDFPPEFPDNMFERISDLESLSTSIDILCFSLFPSVVPPQSLPNLKTLELTTGTNDTPNINKLVRFLTCLPHLESLNLIIEEVLSYNIRNVFLWEDWKLDEAERRGILTRHLKRVEFLNFYKEKLILDLVRCLLEHGIALEEMVFRWDCDEAEFHERSVETMNQVSKFHKASSTVKLGFLNEISYYQLSGKP
ncbi:unnamed protein product [Lactuca saligna]|uniref:F-box domain-containing protein n=1 Tax=Lactuca saligna TaxID=75948 RepID=A0AA36EGA8_LACSI|nr:unnamed protein product [Lactuca saligna]